MGELKETCSNSVQSRVSVAPTKLSTGGAAPMRRLTSPPASTGHQTAGGLLSPIEAVFHTPVVPLGIVSDDLLTSEPELCLVRTEDVVVATDLPAAEREFSDFTDPHLIKVKCKEIVPGWREYSEDRIVVTRILSGLTNQLFCVHLKDHTDSVGADSGAETATSAASHADCPNASRMIVPSRVLFRIYGKDVGELYDPSFELDVFCTLGSFGIAPFLYGQFEGGRIEEWIFGLPLPVKDMTNENVLKAIAAMLGDLHQIHTRNDFPPHWVTEEPVLYHHLRRWTAKAKHIMDSLRPCDSNYEAVHRMDSDGISLYSIYEEMLEESAILSKRLMPSEGSVSSATCLAFCHNDCQENNIMRTTKGARLRLIDFEYAGYNLTGYDIANFFVESILDYTEPNYPYYCVRENDYPTLEQRRMFASVYLSKILHRTVLITDTSIIDPFLDSVERFVLASHLLWGFWSIIRAPQAPTYEDFDFFVYAKDRFKLYRRQLASVELTSAAVE